MTHFPRWFISFMDISSLSVDLTKFDPINWRNVKTNFIMQMADNFVLEMNKLTTVEMGRLAAKGLILCEIAPSVSDPMSDSDRIAEIVKTYELLRPPSSRFYAKMGKLMEGFLKNSNEKRPELFIRVFKEGSQWAIKKISWRGDRSTDRISSNLLVDKSSKDAAVLLWAQQRSLLCEKMIVEKTDDNQYQIRNYFSLGENRYSHHVLLNGAKTKMIVHEQGFGWDLCEYLEQNERKFV